MSFGERLRERARQAASHPARLLQLAADSHSPRSVARFARPEGEARSKTMRQKNKHHGVFGWRSLLDPRAQRSVLRVRFSADSARLCGTLRFRPCAPRLVCMPLEADGGLPSRLLEDEEPILLETPAAPGLDAELGGRRAWCGLFDLCVLQSEPCSSSSHSRLNGG